MAFHPSIIFILGLLILIVGAELILRSSSRIASMLGIKPIIIGLTIVAIGTSAPELAVGITAVGEGKGILAVGNIAGTNIVNILLILGLSAAIRALPLELLSIKLDVPVMVFSSLVLFVMAWDGLLSSSEGIVLTVMGALYMAAIIKISRKEEPHLQKEFAEEFGKPAKLVKPRIIVWVYSSLILAGGILCTVVGANFLVDGAVSIASGLGVSDAIIGLTIVAIGTSAPELVTTIVATIKNDRDVAVGNLIGSSITNILIILGITCIASGSGIDVSREVLRFDLPLAAAVALICYPVFRTGRRVSRIEGAIFVVLYTAYLGTLIFLRT